MNCYYHQNKVSVGICRYCLKGVCSDCAVDIEGGLACRDKCEQQAKMVVRYLRKSMSSAESYNKIYANSNKGMLFSSLFVTAIGLTYLVFPWFYAESDGTWFYLIGIIFLLAGLFLGIRARKLKPMYDKLAEENEQ